MGNTNHIAKGERMKRLILAGIFSGILSGCVATTHNIGSLVLPTSNKKIDVVQHRSDSKECAVGWVIQTYDAAGVLVDAKSGHGNALHCQVIGATIDAGGRAGAGALGAARTSIINSQGQDQGQFQGQGQHQSQSQKQNDSDNTHHGYGN